MDDVNAPSSPPGNHEENDFPAHDNSHSQLPLPPIHVPDGLLDFDGFLRRIEAEGEDRLPSIDEVEGRGGNDYDYGFAHFVDSFPSPRQSQSPFDFDYFLGTPDFRPEHLPVAANHLDFTFSRAEGSRAVRRHSEPISIADEEFLAEITFPPTPQDTQERNRHNEPIDLTISSPTMPPTTSARKRKRSIENAASASTAAKSTSGPKSNSPKAKRDSVEVVDLEDIEEKEEYEAFQAKQQAEAIRRQNEEEANKPVRLADFQCIICMDQPTDLTVTHCGHLFCGECLHSALHAGDKKCCPVCRSNISISTTGRKSKQGVFPLQMKLMTAVRKGKQPAKA